MAKSTHKSMKKRRRRQGLTLYIAFRVGSMNITGWQGYQLVEKKVPCIKRCRIWAKEKPDYPTLREARKAHPDLEYVR